MTYTDDNYILRAIELSIDKRRVFAHVYRNEEIFSLHKGGRQLLYDKDILEAVHTVSADVMFEEPDPKKNIVRKNVDIKVQIFKDMTFYLEAVISRNTKNIPPTIKFRYLEKKEGEEDLLK